MKKTSVIERRNPANPLQIFVDIAVNRQRTVGSQQAINFLLSNQVPGPIITRILQAAGQRRLTCWERHVDERGLRRALGAPPLLHVEASATDTAGLTIHLPCMDASVPVVEGEAHQ